MKDFISFCTITFKNYEHEVQLTMKNDTIWQFTSYYPRSNKNYAIFCSTDLAKSQALIKAAAKQAKKNNMRLVVISKDDVQHQLTDDYCLTSFNMIRDYNELMMKAKYHH